MTWITKNVEAAVAMEEVIMLSSVDWMFEVVAGKFSEGEHNGQKKWNRLGFCRRSKLLLLNF